MGEYRRATGEHKGAVGEHEEAVREKVNETGLSARAQSVTCD